MKTMRYLLGFLIVAAVTATCSVVLLLPPPHSCVCRVVPPEEELIALGTNGTLAESSMKKLQKATSSGDDDDELRELLRRAAMDDRTVILTFTNEAWTAPGSLLDLFLESFREGVRTAQLLKHLVIVAVDGRAHERCQRVHPLCHLFRVADGVDFAAEQEYMKKDYLDMMWRRHRFQHRVLELGYSFVFTDVDIVWLRNPLLRVPVAADLAMSCDRFYGDNPYDLNKTANGGFIYARASARTVAFFQSWRDARDAFPGWHEQYVFDQTKHALAARHGVRVQFVDTAYLSGFCELRKDFYKVCTVHGNCLVGLQSKLDRLREVLDEWKQFKEEAALLGSNTTGLTD